MAARRREAARKAASAKSVPAGERPSEDPEVLRRLHAENIHTAGEALRALKLPNDVEPCVVFRA